MKQSISNITETLSGLGWEREDGRWKMEVGSGEMEDGRGKMGDGSWKVFELVL